MLEASTGYKNNHCTLSCMNPVRIGKEDAYVEVFPWKGKPNPEHLH